MEIRQLVPDDAAAFQEVRLLALQESPTAFGSSYVEEVDRPLDVVVERLVDPNNDVFGAFSAANKLVGIIILRRETRVKRAHKAFVLAMYVVPGSRGRGVGRTLLEQVIARARELGVRQLNLGVTADNRAAVALYESCGFERYGLERDAFRVGEQFYDVAYMARRLTEME